MTQNALGKSACAAGECRIKRAKDAGDDDQARAARARRAWEEAREVARDPGVPGPMRDLVERRLAALPEPTSG